MVAVHPDSNIIGKMSCSVLLLAAACIVGVVMGDVCPGGQWTCATGMTCCTLPSGQEGCCPYTNATCCADQVHCCPMGTTCSTKGGGHCQDQSGTNVAWSSLLEEGASSKQNLVSVAVPILGSEMCSDGSQCPDDSTCCLMNGGRFGCCPFSDAMCCSDKLHCCPEGTFCDDASGHCHSQQAELKHSSGNATWSISIDCPSGEFKCPEGDTCCSVGKGDWGCCPLLNAVCCADQEHCCPNGYRCVGSGTCAKQ